MRNTNKQNIKKQQITRQFKKYGPISLSFENKAHMKMPGMVTLGEWMGKGQGGSRESPTFKKKKKGKATFYQIKMSIKEKVSFFSSH